MGISAIGFNRAKNAIGCVFRNVSTRLTKPSERFNILKSTAAYAEQYQDIAEYKALLKFIKENPIEKELPFFSKVRSFFSRLFTKPNQKYTSISKPPNIDEYAALSQYQMNPGFTESTKFATPEKINPCDFRREKLQGLLQKSFLNNDMVLYRGVKDGEILHNANPLITATKGIPYDDFKKLKTYKSNNFVSTSTMPDVAYEFGNYNGVIARIFAPKGTKGIFIPEYIDDIIDARYNTALMAKKSKFSEFASPAYMLGQKHGSILENELLLPCNTKFKILKHNNVGDIKVIDAIVEKQ